MTLSNHRLTTDGEIIEPCCVKMDEFISDDMAVADSERHYVIFTRSMMKRDRHDTLCSFCPFCGAKLEYVDKLEGE